MRLHASIRNLLFLALVMLAIPAASHAQIALSVAIAPPELPVYDQPVCPGDDYIWTPGYWYYGDDDYYWVPGTWVIAPEVGYLWTPPYWGWEGSAFFFHAGYWGPHIGFYGGINYGFGYFGHGFEGGRWDNGHFFYNRAVMNVGVNIRNVYNTRVDVRTDTRVSFNGGRGGITERANADEEAASRDRHVGPIAAQEQHRESARTDPQQRFSTNHGRPAVAATARPGELKGGGAATTHEVTRPESGTARTGNPGHVKDLPAAERPAPVKTGNAKTDQKYQQQQEKLNTKQDQERQKVQQKQEQDHQRLDKQKANDTTRQQTEQRHQQQTQQLVQKHTQQQQQLQQRQQPAARPSGGSKPK
jgi:hypothetical protein